MSNKYTNGYLYAQINGALVFQESNRYHEDIFGNTKKSIEVAAVDAVANGTGAKASYPKSEITFMRDKKIVTRLLRYFRPITQ